MRYVRTHLLACRPSTLLLVAAVFLSMTLSFFVSSTPAVAAPKFYIKIAVTETKTTVGQQPKLVLTFGNKGDKPIYSYYGYCYDTQNKLDFTGLNFVYHELIPGQNDNATFTTYARSSGTTYVKCNFEVYTQNASGFHTDYVSSNSVKVVIKPQ